MRMLMLARWRPSLSADGERPPLAYHSNRWLYTGMVVQATAWRRCGNTLGLERHLGKSHQAPRAPHPDRSASDPKR